MKKLFPNINIQYSNSNVIIPELDGIRGLAIVLVIAHHCFRLTIGWVGVDLFFVLSGFLITGILLDTKTNEHYYRNFWTRRILRIFPLYYSVLILILLPSILFQIDTIGAPLTSYWFYLQNWQYTFDGCFPSGKATLNHFWSLAIEEQFYFVFPIFIKLARPKDLLIIASFFIILSIIFRYFFYFNNNVGYYVFTFSRIDALLIGATLAYLIRNKKELIEKYVHYVLIFSSSVFLIILLNGTWKNSDKYFATFGYTIIALFFSTIIIYSISSYRFNFLQKIFNNEILKFLGKIAYGLYIYHFILYVLIKPSLEIYIFDIIQNNYLSKIIVSLLIVAITIILSIFSYSFFEKKFLALKNKFTL